MQDEASVLVQGCLALVVIVAIVVVAVVWVGGQLGEAVQDARVSLSADRTERAQAQAQQAEARADIARERTDAARETNLHRETMFYSWTVALKAFTSENVGAVVALAVLLGLGVGAVVIRVLERVMA